MKTVNIHEAKTQLSKLAEAASKGESCIIAKAGKPVVKVTALNAPTGAQVCRLGFMAGQISVPDNFDQMGREAIGRIFAGGAPMTGALPPTCGLTGKPGSRFCLILDKGWGFFSGLFRISATALVKSVHP